jgi:hypothetical protein
MRKHFQEILENVLKHEKCSKNSKIAGKFPELDWSMNNPNKVFVAHENFLEPSNK